jgi:hypothetical protein
LAFFCGPFAGGVQAAVPHDAFPDAQERPQRGEQQMVGNGMTDRLRTGRRRRAGSRVKIGGAVGLLVCATALLGSASAFAAPHTTDQVRRSAPEIHIPAPHCHGCTATAGTTSSNWSGYAQTGNGFFSISAT